MLFKDLFDFNGILFFYWIFWGSLICRTVATLPYVSLDVWNSFSISNFKASLKHFNYFSPFWIFVFSYWLSDKFIYLNFFMSLHFFSFYIFYIDIFFLFCSIIDNFFGFWAWSNSTSFKIMFQSKNKNILSKLLAEDLSIKTLC